MQISVLTKRAILGFALHQEGGMNGARNASRRLNTLATLAAGVLLAGCGLTPEIPTVTISSLTLAKCQAKLETVSTNLDNSLRLALRQCVDLYRKSLVTGMPVIATAATKCDTALGKALTFPDPTFKSATAKAVKQIGTALTTNVCTAKDLVALGHLPAAASSIDPAELIVAQRIKAALQNQQQLVRDSAAVFDALNTAGCTRCASLEGPPCINRTCKLGVSSATFAGMPLLGTIDLEVCDLPGIPQNAFAVYAATQNALRTPSDPLMASSCTQVVGAEGFISKTSGVTVNIPEFCQDRVVSAPDTDECPALLSGNPVCGDTAADPILVGVTNGGACMSFNPGVSTPGASNMMISAKIRATSGDGPDTVPCTSDDPLASASSEGTVPMLLSTSTGVDGNFLDKDGTNGLTTLTTRNGTAFDPAAVSDGVFTGGVWVGALPGMRALGGNDGIVDVIVQCD